MNLRSGSLHTPLLFVLGCAGLLLVCGTLLWSSGRSSPSQGRGGSLRVHCAAGMRAPVLELAQDYEELTGTQVELNFGGSGTLLASIRAGAGGDLYLAGDVSFVELAQESGDVLESLELASMKPVIGVARGNPLRLETLKDLARPDLRVGLGHPEASAIGRVAREVLEQSGSWSEVRKNLKVEKPTVNELAADLALGALDAAIVWDTSLAGYEELEALRLNVLQELPQRITVGVLATSQQAPRALGFARFLASSDRAAPVFREHGFTASEGDPFVERPRLVLMSGAMLRPAVEETLQEFELREGVEFERVYNGCGILVAQMHAGTLPDAYFSCDGSFLEAVQPEFEVGIELASNPMVILVQRGNPERLEALADLARPGLRIGLGHPEKSALGALTRKLLVSEGVHQPLQASGNLKVESSTGDLLVNQLRAGSLDATIVYASNAALAAEHLQSIPLSQPGALAIQPFAIQRDSSHRQLLARLFAALGKDESRARFEELGFIWLGGQKP